MTLGGEKLQLLVSLERLLKDVDPWNEAERDNRNYKIYHQDQHRSGKGEFTWRMYNMSAYSKSQEFG